MSNKRSNFSLKFKTILLTLVPIGILTLGIFYLFKDNLQLIKKSENTLYMAQLMQVNANVISALQVERGKSAVLAAGGHQNNTGVLAQREKVDELLIAQETFLRTNLIPTEFVETELAKNSLGFREKITASRAVVDGKATVGETLKSYTGIIMVMIKGPINLAEKLAPNAVPAIKTNVELQLAQESSGKLRANLASSLKADVPLSLKKIKALTTFKGNVDTVLASPTLKMSPENQVLLDQFYASNDWQEVNQTFLMMLSKASTGDFGKNASAFFAVISKSVGRIIDIVANQNRYIQDTCVSAITAANQSLMWFGFLGLLVVGFTLMLSFRVSTRIQNKVLHLTNSLLEERIRIGELAKRVQDVSHKTNQGTSTQAAAVEQTAASIEEIAAMTENNRSNAEKAGDAVMETHDLITRGNQGLSVAKEEVDKMEKANKNMETLLKVVQEIGSKTEIIDTIAFQTKILSFNAAVEAERAGEYGRGFSVVAQEVGSLADLSANASKEISDMVKSGVKSAKAVVEESFEQSSRVREKVESLLETFIAIEGKCNELESSSSSISSSTKEQSEGIKQAATAMNDIEQVASSNALNAGNADQDATSMLHSLVKITELTDSLISCITGKNEAKLIESPPLVTDDREKDIEGDTFKTAA